METLEPMRTLVNDQNILRLGLWTDNETCIWLQNAAYFLRLSDTASFRTSLYTEWCSTWPVHFQRRHSLFLRLNRALSWRSTHGLSFGRTIISRFGISCLLELKKWLTILPRHCPCSLTDHTKCTI